MDYKHLKKNHMSYCAHFRKAAYVGISMMVGGVLCFIHAFLPFIFVESASKTNKRIGKIL
jgi:hypothetical protein